MFIRLEPEDLSIIRRGLFLFLSFIIMGVTVAENQVNSLTQNQEIAKAFNFSQNKGIYSGYMLGCEYSTSFILPVGKIYNTEQELVVEINNHTFIIPLRVQFNLSNVLALASEGHGRFRNESFKTKQVFEKSLKRFREKIRFSL